MPRRVLVQTGLRRKATAPAVVEASEAKQPPGGIISAPADDITPTVYPIMMAGPASAPSPATMNGYEADPRFEWEGADPDPYEADHFEQPNAVLDRYDPDDPYSMDADAKHVDLNAETEQPDALIMGAEDSRLPTGYVKSSCQQMPQYAIASFTLALGMSVSKCFHFCSRRLGIKFFGLTRGHECFCSQLPPGSIVSSDQCDIKCTGAPADQCGGVNNIASVYTMIDCAEPSQNEQDRKAAEKKAKLVASYKAMEGESCGQSLDGRAQLDGSDVMPGFPNLDGVPEDCAVACWEAKGAEYCAGFTYDSMLERCTFHADVFEGDVIKKKGLKCFFKKLQIDL